MTTPTEVKTIVPTKRGSNLLRLIGIFKIAKAILLIMIAMVAFDLINKDIGVQLKNVAHHLHIAPGSRLLERAIESSTTITNHKLELAATVLLLYAAMFATEGIGLVMKKHWAEWMAVITTAGLIPFEIREIYEKHSALRISALAINIIIAVYLVFRAREETRDKKAATSPS